MKRAMVVLCSVWMVWAASTRLHSQASAVGADWLLSVTILSSPAAPNSGQPQLSTLGDRVVLSWVERTGDRATLRFAERTDGGWTEARTVASGASHARLKPTLEWTRTPRRIGLPRLPVDRSRSAFRHHVS